MGGSKQGFRASSSLLLLAALACVGPSVAQNVLGIDFGSEWIKLAVVQRSAGVQIVLNEVKIPLFLPLSIMSTIGNRRVSCETGIA